ncbi:MAG: T9SS type A sorting domain-containing protein [Bacteroidia bacterium]
MKKTTLFLFAAIAFILLGSFANKKILPKNYFFKGDNSAQNAADYFFKIRRNQKTGTIDPKDVLNAEIAVNQLRKNHTSNSTQSIGLNWSELGPDNLGGVTRAILIDKNNSNRIFAGAVSGGLWISNNAGSTWSPYNDQLADFAVTCITQSANGDIYFGTGEGGTYQSTGVGYGGIIGGGIWKSTDDGNTFNVLLNTVPAVNSLGVLWNTNFTALASDPTDSNRIYAASIRGLYISQNAGNTWTIENSTRAQNSYDVKVGSDGSVFAAIGSSCYTSATGLPGSYTVVGSTLPTGTGFSLAIAVQDPNYLYASIANSDGTLEGIYQSTDKGATWIDIGPGGSPLFSPFQYGTSSEYQGTYDNIITVFPNNKYKILLGGVTLYSWVQTNPSNPGVGQWTNISDFEAAEPGDSYFANTDQHAIAITSSNPNIIYFGNDEGVYKSFDGGITFAPYNKYYNAMESYSVAFPPFETNGEGCLSGTGNSGTFYLGGNGTSPMDATEIFGPNAYNGGYGGDCEISMLNPSIFFITGQYTPVLRSLNNGANFSSPFSIRLANLNNYLNSGVAPLALYESPNDPLSHDSITFISDSNYVAGDTLHFLSMYNNNVPFSYITTNPINKTDTVKIQDPVQSKLVQGFSGSEGVWMTVRPIETGIYTPYWYQICNVSGDVSTMAWTGDGDHLFVGTDNGQIERVDNLSAILHSDNIPVHGVSVIDSVTGDISSAQHVEITDVIADVSQYVTRIAVDPNNGNNIVITMGSYGSPSYVKYSNNALSASPTFTNVQGNLPKMPVYSALITKDNPHEVILGTEHGIWATTDITQGNSTVWTSENNNQMPNVPVLMLRQQTAPYWWSNINNSGKIYAATYGRGLWSCDNYLHPYTTGVPENKFSTSNIVVYPDPIKENGTVSFKDNKSENLTVNIFNLKGELLETFSFYANAGRNNINFTTKNLISGTYLLNIYGKNKNTWNTKFVVLK